MYDTIMRVKVDHATKLTPWIADCTIHIVDALSNTTNILHTIVVMAENTHANVVAVAVVWVQQRGKARYRCLLLLRVEMNNATMTSKILEVGSHALI